MVLIIISKLSYSYVVCVKVNGRSFTRELGSNHPEAAAEAAIAAWRDFRHFPNGVSLNLPPEVIKAVVATLGLVPWT